MEKINPHYLKRVFYIHTEVKKTLTSESLVIGSNVYGEQVFNIEGREFRAWDPYRSKLSAGISIGMKKLPQFLNKRVLYLGAASGTTVSHISDLVGEDGLIFAVEFFPRTAMKLIALSEERPNIIPIVADARKPETYSHLVFNVDVIFQDISQPDQAQILVNNANSFLKNSGTCIFSIKTRSIDSAVDTTKIIEQQSNYIKKKGYNIIETKMINRFEKEHGMIVITKDF